jgi:uncharacterized membrane protein (UPF0136 family)
MNVRNARLAKLCGFCAVVGAIIGYLRNASFSSTIAGAIFFLVVWGIVGILITTPNSRAN